MAVFTLLFLLFSSFTLSADLKDCNKGFIKLEAAKKLEAFEKHPILKLLEKEIKKNRKKKHELVFSGGQFIFKVDFLDREETRLLVLLYKAVQEGAITKIDAGTVLGPKVLTMLNSLRSRLKGKGSKLEIYGTFDYGKIINSPNDRMPLPSQRIKDGQADFWSDHEEADYLKAIKALNVSECSKYLDSLRNCQFYMNVSGGKSNIKYSKPE